MKYIFCIVALLIQPLFTWYTYHKQDKRQTAMKMPMIYFSGVYLVVQLLAFIVCCALFSDNNSAYSYLIQAAILIVFIIIELSMFGSNSYIERVEEQEQDSIRDFKSIISEMEICKVMTEDEENKKAVDVLLEKMRYSDPVSSPEVEQENNKIHELIAELQGITDRTDFKRKCGEIEKQLEIRRIKNTKVKG